MLEFLKKPVSAKALGIFRIAFGLLMVFQFSKIKRRIAYFDDKEYLYFPFPELDWVPIFSSSVMSAIWAIGLIATVLLILGFGYKYAAAVVTFTYGYFISLDAVYFNNHYYLIFLLSFLLIFTDAHKSYSLGFGKKKSNSIVPYWQYFILQLQIAIVFFYGGISKCSEDWFSGSIIKGITDSAFLNNFLIYGGTVFDLLIPFALFFRKTRFVAIIFVVMFNISNNFLFDDIASFPILVIASMVLFMVDGSMPSIIQKFFAIDPKTTHIEKTKPFITWALVAYFIFQLIYPLRHYVIPGHVDWTGQGHYFAWRMKSYTKDIHVDFYAYDIASGKRAYKINHGIDNYKIQRITSMPHMIPRLAENIRKKIEKQDGVNINLGIAVDYNVGFNQRAKKLAINPNFDISRASFDKYDQNVWLIPLDN